MTKQMTIVVIGSLRVKEKYDEDSVLPVHSMQSNPDLPFNNALYSII